MTTLIDILKKETESLRVQYLEMTEKWARKYFSLCEERKLWKEVDWCKYFGLESELKNPKSSVMQFYGFPKGFYNSREAKEYNKLKNEIYSITRLGLDGYLKKQKEYAEQHYQDSIAKLAFRIETKGLDITKLTVKTSHIGVNIDTVLTDGEKTVKAFTIIAQGQVQRPHYRYLVK